MDVDAEVKSGEEEDEDSSIGIISSKIVQVKDRLSSMSSSIYGWTPREDSGNVDLKDLRPPSPTSIDCDECGFPLTIFTKVNIEKT